MSLASLQGLKRKHEALIIAIDLPNEVMNKRHKTENESNNAYAVN